MIVRDFVANWFPCGVCELPPEGLRFARVRASEVHTARRKAIFSFSIYNPLTARVGYLGFALVVKVIPIQQMTTTEGQTAPNRGT